MRTVAILGAALALVSSPLSAAPRRDMSVYRNAQQCALQVVDESIKAGVDYRFQPKRIDALLRQLGNAGLRYRAIDTYPMAYVISRLDTNGDGSAWLHCMRTQF